MEAPFWQLKQSDRAHGRPAEGPGFAPDSPDVLLDVAIIYRESGQPERCLTTLHQLHDTYPPGEEPQSVLVLEGLALIDLGRPQQAIESLIRRREQARQMCMRTCLARPIRPLVGMRRPERPSSRPWRSTPSSTQPRTARPIGDTHGPGRRRDGDKVRLVDTERGRQGDAKAIPSRRLITTYNRYNRYGRKSEQNRFAPYDL